MYTLTVTSNPTEGGTINPTSGEYEEGTEITINVTPNTNYEFDKWSGNWSGTESPLTIIMDGNKTLVGNFNFLDSDGDGVGDDDDLDNNTQSGFPVDENGVMLNPIFLDDNGITIKSYDWSEVGDSGEINGVTYTIVSEQQLRSMISQGEELTTVCTSKITDMSKIFRFSQFNGDISSWDVSNVTDMSWMFGVWGSSINPFDGDISHWDVSSVKIMKRMFLSSQFNGDISNWDVSSVTDMEGIFMDSQFNGDISNWDVSS
ncbi:MAG: BspA family leucine-rich repeat surface protein, partial [Flavobacteriaceae bacterium]|nr:BspA family leucine-rich repeat surface protein [Flavobacteriaceae bacterium]